MVLKKENSIYVATSTWGIIHSIGESDSTLIASIFGYIPDNGTIMFEGSESEFLWFKTTMDNDVYYSVIDASVRLHNFNDELDFTVTNYGDIVIYRTSNCSYTPQEVLDSYNRYISSRFFNRDENKEDKKMGTTLHEGEYILLSNKIINKIINEIQLMGYSILSNIGINTSNVNYLGLTRSTKHFSTYAVIKDLELPFSINEWQDFEIKNVRFHAYTKNFKNLILLEKDEFSLDYVDEIDEFFEKKKKENKTMSDRYDPLRLNTIDGLSLNCKPVFLTARGNGKSVMTMKHMLNSIYGLSNKKPPFNFELKFGIEHATGRYKTICLWEDGEKTIICGDNKTTKLPVAQAFAWCYVKRTFRSVSQFKKHVDKRTTKMDGVWYFEGDCLVDEYAQGSVPGSSKKRDIYDAAALAIVTKRYGGLRKLVDEYINKKENE